MPMSKQQGEVTLCLDQLTIFSSLEATGQPSQNFSTSFSNSIMFVHSCYGDNLTDKSFSTKAKIQAPGRSGPRHCSWEDPPWIERRVGKQGKCASGCLMKGSTSQIPQSLQATTPQKAPTTSVAPAYAGARSVFKQRLLGGVGLSKCTHAKYTALPTPRALLRAAITLVSPGGFRGSLRSQKFQ